MKRLRRTKMRRQLKQAEKFNRLRDLMYRKSPYYPNFVIEVRDWETVEMETDRGGALRDVARFMGVNPPNSEKEVKTVIYVMAISSKVRHKHEGTWFVRHHLQTNMYTNTLKETPVWEEEKQRIKDNLIKSLMHEVYLDLKFGQVEPRLETPEGDPVDRKDKLQVSEKQRLRL